MRLIHRKAFAVVYWVIGFAATVLAIVFGAKAAAGQAPEFSDGSGTSVGSQMLFGLGGAVLAGLGVAALFAGIWMALWAADRRANPAADDRDDYDSLDDLDDDFDDAERRNGGADRRGRLDEGHDEFVDDLDGDGHAIARR